MTWELCCNECLKREREITGRSREIKTIGIMRRWPHPCAVCGHCLPAMVHAAGGYYEGGVRVGHYAEGSPVTEIDVKEIRDAMLRVPRPR